MKDRKIILLPGLDQQLVFLNNRLNTDGLNILIIGPHTDIIAGSLAKENNVEIIVEDFESLMNMRLKLERESKIQAKMMDFERTDYANETFDVVYCQGSISTHRRTKIVKEIRRILKIDAYLCVGEVVKLKEDLPGFMKELFSYSDLDPLLTTKVNSFYTERNFEQIDSIDLSNSLSSYYRTISNLSSESIEKLSSKEKSYYKKYLNQIRHESNVYLKLDGDKYMGIITLLLRKK